MKSLVIILLGPPGSGKGTQASLLAEKLNLYYLETSKIIETNIMKAKRGEYVLVDGRYFLEKEKKLWKGGKLITPAVVTFWVRKKIKELFRAGENLVLAGSPRSLYEGKKILPLLKKLYGKSNIKIFLLDLSLESSIFRNSHRRICELMRHPILYHRETIKLQLCPLDGSKLIKRALDKPEIIEKRYKVYEEETLPVVNYFKKEGFRVHKINGEKSVADVFSDILKILK